MLHIICHQINKNENHHKTTIAHLLEWPASQTLTTPNAGETVEQKELLFVAGGNANWYNTLEVSAAASYKTKHTLTIQSSVCTPWYLAKGVENLCLHKNLHIDVYSSFIHNCQNLEATRCPSVSEWIKKLGYFWGMGSYSRLTRNELSGHEMICRKLKCILVRKRSQSEKGAYSLIPTILEKAKPWRQWSNGWPGRGKMTD